MCITKESIYGKKGTIYNMENKTHTSQAKESLLQSAHGFEAQLISFFAKFPHIPENGRKVIADIAPWIALIFGILGILGLLAGGVIATFLALPTLFTGSIWGIIGFISLLISIVIAILQLLAVTPLMAREKKGWNYLFYGLLLGVLSVILSIIGATLTTSSVYVGAGVVNSFVSGVISFLIGGWLLFEIRDQFKA